jgi:hypothetical protein
MRQLFLFFILSVFILSCGQNDSKQKETEIKESDTSLKKEEPVVKVNDTVVSSKDTTRTATGENELLIGSVSKTTQGAPAFNSSTLYLHSKKERDGSFVFLAKASEWGIISINGKIEKLNFVKGYEDEATYANSNYEMTYSLDYRKAEQVENPTAECTITIKAKGYKTYRQKIWGVWGLN